MEQNLIRTGLYIKLDSLDSETADIINVRGPSKQDGYWIIGDIKGYDKQRNPIFAEISEFDLVNNYHPFSKKNDNDSKINDRNSKINFLIDGLGEPVENEPVEIKTLVETTKKIEVKSIPQELLGLDSDDYIIPTEQKQIFSPVLIDVMNRVKIKQEDKIRPFDLGICIQSDWDIDKMLKACEVLEIKDSEIVDYIFSTFNQKALSIALKESLKAFIKNERKFKTVVEPVKHIERQTVEQFDLQRTTETVQDIVVETKIESNKDAELNNILDEIESKLK